MISIWSLSFSLFLLMDSIGNVPIFISVLKKIEPKRQRKIIFRELLIALVILIIFHFIGEGILTLLGIGQHTVMIAGGIILFLIAIRMIFPSGHKYEEGLVSSEPFIVPLAIPLIAGPAALAAVMLYSSQESSGIVIGAICIAWVASTLVLLSSTYLAKALGMRGMIALERLMGLILTMIAIQMLVEGIDLFIIQHLPLK